MILLARYMLGTVWLIGIDDRDLGDEGSTYTSRLMFWEDQNVSVALWVLGTRCSSHFG